MTPKRLDLLTKHGFRRGRKAWFAAHRNDAAPNRLAGEAAQ
jgi:hypothetical protein